MARRKLQYFHISYYDHDTKTFNVVGPDIDDACTTNKTSKLQEEGKRVGVSTTRRFDHPDKLPSVQSLIQEGVEGYKHDPNLKW